MEFPIPRSQPYQPADLRSSREKNDWRFIPNTKKMETTNDEEMETALFDWFKQAGTQSLWAIKSQIHPLDLGLVQAQYQSHPLSTNNNNLHQQEK
ncbi:hypothetical protein PoB_000855400 [Plakobranchus ocellatus]|uniref:Uncharacterized protein n=1 Tax=Plakobranchus ocellatus TaxID=259542 RepID=A0AAV3YGB8_9GAST|nr:hypothetical protein PoB_000855400 [Plakobranchus ocellatus]